MSGVFVPDFGASRGAGRKVGFLRGDDVTKMHRTVQFSDLKLKQEFDFECTVMIWRTGEGWKGALKHPGHAAFLMRKTRDDGPFVYQSYTDGQYRDDSKARYVSFWPGNNNEAELKTRFDPEFKIRLRDGRVLRGGYFVDYHVTDYMSELGKKGATLLDEGSARRQGQILVWTGMYSDPKTNEGRLPHERYGQLPQALIHLPGMVINRPTSLGIQMNRIVDWCLDFRESEDFNYQYISTSNNCAGVAVRALAAGGADAFAAIGGCSGKSSIYFTPNDAEVWAKAVAAGIQRVNAWLSTLNFYSPKESRWGLDMPTVAEWKAASHKSFSFRGSETRGVDNALAVWHACQQGKDPKSFPKAFGALVQLIQHTFMHMQKDPNSGRNEAYRQLARAILEEVKHLAQISNKSWSDTSFYD